MKFTIITPSFNQLPYLKRCVASVRDQVSDRGVGCDVLGVKPRVSSDLNPKAENFPPQADLPGAEKPNTKNLTHRLTEPFAVHHHIQDGGSTDGTVDWLECYANEVREQGFRHEALGVRESNPDAQCLAPSAQLSGYSFSYASEPDNGMYDALNKGISFALQKQFPDNRQLTAVNCDDEIIAWLNCDEQYLPGALQRAARFFEAHPEADFVYGDVLMVDPEGALLTYRKNPPLRRAYVQADHLYTQSAAMFFRAVIFLSGTRFNPVWKAVGDCDFVVRTLANGFRPAQIKDYIAVCTMTGENLSRRSAGVDELLTFRRTVPLLFRAGRPLFNVLRYFEKFLRGGYRQAMPLEYELCTDDSAVRKKNISETASSRFRWDDHE